MLLCGRTEKIMKKIAAISTILADPAKTQTQFNSVVSDFQDIVRGRLGCPFEDEKIAAISIIVFLSISS